MSAVNREEATLSFLRSDRKSVLQLYALKAFPNTGEILQEQMQIIALSFYTVICEVFPVDTDIG